MSVSFGYDFGKGWLTEEGYDGFASNAPRPFELVTFDFSISTTRLIGVVTAFDAHFLLVFFPFRLAKLGIGRL